MASGYTCCIDLERLKNTIEVLSSLEECLETRDLRGSFIDIEDKIKDINFEHNNCITDYKDEMDSIQTSLLKIEKEILELEEALRKTVAEYSNTEEIGEEDLKEIGKLYSKEIPSIKGPIEISQNIDLYKENMDDSIQNFMIENSMTDYPEEYHSIEEWALSLEEKYKELEENEKILKIDKEMATWRQEKTGATVASTVTSEYAEEQSHINLWKEEYRLKYGATKEEASRLANLRFQYERNKDSSINEVEALKQKLGKIGDNILQELQQEPQTIPVPPPVQEEESKEINTVPIGLGIGAAGITGSIGAVILSEQNRKKNFTLDDYKDSTEEEYREPAPSNVYDYPPKIEDPDPYHASRDREKLGKFYKEDYYYEEESEDEE